MQRADAILGLIGERGKKGLPLEQRVYRLLYNRDLYLMAYGKIYRNAGAMTHGVTDETPDGMSLAKIDASIDALRYERFQWLPARRTYIPKKNGKKRPLGMPVWTDKLVQEVLRLILEAYYEPTFSDHSHGFRPGRGPHTALREIYRTWRGTTWFIEGDISKCFDNLDHDLLLSILSEHIHDTRFTKLLRGLFDAGYMEDWTYSETLSGVPQGGIVSPVLSNILLDKLDKFVENVLIPQYTKGAKRRRNQEYHKLLKLSLRFRQQGNIEEAERLRNQAQKLPSSMTDDPDYRRLNYVRYADDFLLGFIGPKSEAEAIKQQLKTFLREQLKLELSEEKTLVTHARSEAARFLGYAIATLHDDAKRTKRKTNGIGQETKCRSVNRQIGLQVPQDVIKAKCERYKRGEETIQRAELLERSDYDIVMTYQLEYRGIVNYYRLAYNMHRFRELRRVMETSLTKTLAHKHKVPVPKIYEKYETILKVQGKEYKGLQTSVPREDKPPLVATWGGIPLKRDMEATLEERPPRIYGNRTELVQRLLADFCELCGNDKDVEVHHVRAMRKLHEYPGRSKPEWVKRMIAMRRKTLLLCKRCHEAVEHGLPITWTTLTLKEVKARRKARMTTILESRVQFGNVLTWARRFLQWVPIRRIEVERVKFDLALMQNPEIKGVEYQRGELAGWELRAYLLEKFQHRCAYCGRTQAAFELDHIRPRSRGGSTRASNLALSCHDCNQAKGSRTATEWGHPEVEAHAKTPLKDAAAVNATRYKLVENLGRLGLPVATWSGGRTRWNRERFGIEKDHCLDALCVGELARVEWSASRILLIRAKGRGSYQRTNVDASGFPRGYLTREKRIQGFSTGDLVQATVPAHLKTRGLHLGRVAVRASGSIRVGKTDGINARYCRVVQRADGYAYTSMKASAALPPQT